MKEKKKILFVIDSLRIGGAEKSLVTLLNRIDYQSYDVDLQLFGFGGQFERYLPSEVNVLPPLPYNRFLSKSIWRQIRSFRIKFILAHLVTSAVLKFRHSDAREISRVLWANTQYCYQTTGTKYYAAIAYAQGFPTFYVADKVQTLKKYAWVNADYTLSGKDRRFQIPRYNKFDKVVAVSDSSRDAFLKGIPELTDNILVIRDLIDADFMLKMSEYPVAKPIAHDVPALVTVSRIEANSKGFDIAIEVARLLKERNVLFRWYIVGWGGYVATMKDKIKTYGLDENIVFLGSDPNPYPYIKQATVYFQTSRYESFGLSIAEARILNVPVVTTEFSGVYNQMVPGKNGIVVPIDPKAVADAIEDLLNHPEKREAISAYQRTEKKGNLEEFQKFLRLIES